MKAHYYAIRHWLLHLTSVDNSLQNTNVLPFGFVTSSRCLWDHYLLLKIYRLLTRSSKNEIPLDLIDVKLKIDNYIKELTDRQKSPTIKSAFQRKQHCCKIMTSLITHEEVKREKFKITRTQKYPFCVY